MQLIFVILIRLSKLSLRSELESSQMRTNDKDVLANDQLVKSMNRISKLCVRNLLSHCEDLLAEIENRWATNKK